ncbi:MAG: hypothetical protein WA051_00260 [Minisyncoccia bacterium]
MDKQAILKRIDLCALILIPIFAVILSVFFHSKYLISVLLFYFAPALYLIIRYRNYSFELKDLIFTIVFATPFAIVVDYIGTISGLWLAPSSIILPRFLGVIPLEDFLWMFTGTYLIIILYQSFFDRGKHELVDHKIWRFILPATMLMGLFLYLVDVNYQIFFWPGKYTYLVLCSVFFLFPATLFLSRYPKFFKKILAVTSYFFYVTFLFEFTATYLKQWIFTGSYIVNPISLFGFGSVAIEELFFVGIVGPIAAIAFYEYFDDDLK